MVNIRVQKTFQNTNDLIVGVVSGYSEEEEDAGQRTEVYLEIRSGHLSNKVLSAELDGVSQSVKERVAIKVSGYTELVSLGNALEWAGKQITDHVDDSLANIIPGT